MSLTLPWISRSFSQFASARPPVRRRRAVLAPAVSKALESLERRYLFTAISTDQSDYVFGQTALISGSEFAPDEMVQLQVRHTAGTEGSNDDPQNQAWTVQADATGNITATWVVDDPDAIGATYDLTAVGLSSGFTAATQFTDASSIQSATVNGATSVAVQGGSSVTINITVKNTANDNWRSTGYRISTTPPG